MCKNVSVYMRIIIIITSLCRYPLPIWFAEVMGAFQNGGES